MFEGDIPATCPHDQGMSMNSVKAGIFINVCIFSIPAAAGQIYN